MAKNYHRSVVILSEPVAAGESKDPFTRDSPANKGILRLPLVRRGDSRSLRMTVVDPQDPRGMKLFFRLDQHRCLVCPGGQRLGLRGDPCGLVCGGHRVDAEI